MTMDEKTFAPSVSSTERARPKVRRRRRRIFGLVLLVLAALAIVALAVVALRPKPVPVDVASVRRGSVELAVTEDGRTRIKDRYAAYPGDALPAVPPTWSSVSPSMTDLSTPFGQLFQLLRREADPDMAGSLVNAFTWERTNKVEELQRAVG